MDIPIVDWLDARVRLKRLTTPASRSCDISATRTLTDPKTFEDLPPQEFTLARLPAGCSRLLTRQLVQRRGPLKLNLDSTSCVGFRVGLGPTGLHRWISVHE